MLDRLALRCLGGLRVVDHLGGQTLMSGLRIESQTLRLARTASGVFQIIAAPGFEDYARSFDPIPAVAQQSFDFAVHDLSRRFLPVAGTIALPRNAEPDATDNRVDTPITVALPSAGSRFPTAGMTALRVTLVDQHDAPIRGALVQARHADSGDELGWGLSDRLGSAFVPLLGIPPLQAAAGEGGALETAITPVRLRLTVDPARGWPANVTRLRTGAAPLIRRNPNLTIPLTAGGAVHRRLALTLN